MAQNSCCCPGVRLSATTCRSAGSTRALRARRKRRTRWTPLAQDIAIDASQHADEPVDGRRHDLEEEAETAAEDERHGEKQEQDARPPGPLLLERPRQVAWENA